MIFIDLKKIIQQRNKKSTLMGNDKEGYSQEIY